MLKKLTKTGNSLALVLDKPLLDRAQIDADTPLEVSTDGIVFLMLDEVDRTPRGLNRAIGMAAGHQVPRPLAVCTRRWQRGGPLPNLPCA